MSDPLQTRHDELSIRRDELAERLRRINLDYRRGLSSDSEEQAQELENAAVLQEIARIAAEELNSIDLALQRLEQAMRQKR